MMSCVPQNEKMSKLLIDQNIVTTKNTLFSGLLENNWASLLENNTFLKQQIRLSEILSYPCYLTQAVTSELFNSCIETHIN